MEQILEIKDLHVEIENKEIIKGVDLKLDLGKVNALMGPNGSGKSTLANAIMGHPNYKITSGKIMFNGKDITNMSPDKKAKRGLFLSFQYPEEVSGVTISNLLRTAYNNIHSDKLSLLEFKELLEENAEKLGINKDFLERYLNEGFSGGEKKKSEILQLLTLKPKLAILDETDSGLDIDSLRTVAEGVEKSRNENNSFLIITHYKRILNYIKPDNVFIMINGKIVLEGGKELVDQLEEKGYNWIKNEK